MIKYGAGLIVRAMVELGLVLLVFAGLLGVVAYRTARLFATPTPDKLDRLAGGLATTLGLAAGRAARENADPQDRPPDTDTDGGEPEYLTEEEERQSEDFWRSVCVYGE